MKTALYTTLFLDGMDDRCNSRFGRALKWVKYYAALKEELGFDEFVFCDDGSNPEFIKLFLAYVESTKIPYKFIAQINLKGTNTNYDYPWCWRGIWEMRNLLDDYSRLISIESDFFILSQDLIDHTRNMQSGWWSILEHQYNWPESAFHVLNEDAYDLFRDFTSQPWKPLLGLCLETSLPFTAVYSNFNYARFGEKLLQQTPGMDAYGQCPTDIDMKFRLSESGQV